MNNLQEQARAHYKRGEYQKAIGLFDRAIGRAPSVQLLDNRAACYEKLNDYSNALKDAKKTIQHHREDATGYLRAGKVLVKMEKESVALEIYTHGLKCIRHVGQGYELLRKAHKELMDKLSPPTSVDPLTMLPRELAELILEYLSFRQRINACLVSKQWDHFIRSSPSLWQHLDLSRTGRKKVRLGFISKIINVAKTKLTAATLNNLYDFDKTLAALVKFCPLEELTLLECGLQGNNLTKALTSAKKLKSLTLGQGTNLQSYELQHLLRPLSDHLETFHCTISEHGTPRLDGATYRNLTHLNMTLEVTRVLKTLLADVSERFPVLKSLVIHQRKTSLLDRPGERMYLEKCTKLQHLDLNLVFQSARFLTLPPSLITLKLTPLLVADPAGFFLLYGAGPEQEYTLPHLEELTVELPVLPISDVTKWLARTEQQHDSAALEPSTASKLRKLSIKAADSNPQSFQKVLDHPRLSELEQLSLRGVQSFKDETVTQITETLPKLKVLDLSETDITGVGVKQALKAKALQQLVVNDCRFIGNDAIGWARSQGIRVQYRMSDSVAGGRKIRY